LAQALASVQGVFAAHYVTVFLWRHEHST